MARKTITVPIAASLLLLPAALWVGWAARDYLGPGGGPSPIGTDVIVCLSAAADADGASDRMLVYSNVEIFKFDEDNGGLEIKGHMSQVGGPVRRNWFEYPPAGHPQLRHDLWPPGSVRRIEFLSGPSWRTLKDPSK